MIHMLLRRKSSKITARIDLYATVNSSTGHDRMNIQSVPLINNVLKSTVSRNTIVSKKPITPLLSII